MQRRELRCELDALEIAKRDGHSAHISGRRPRRNDGSGQ